MASGISRNKTMEDKFKYIRIIIHHLQNKRLYITKSFDPTNYKVPKVFKPTNKKTWLLNIEYKLFYRQMLPRSLNILSFKTMKKDWEKV